MPEVKNYEGKKGIAFFYSKAFIKQIVIIALLFLVLKITNNTFIALTVWTIIALIANFKNVKEEALKKSIILKQPFTEAVQDVATEILKTYCLLIILCLVIYAFVIHLINNITL